MLVLLANVVDGADVRVIQRRGGLRFAPETGQSVEVLRNVFGQELESDKAVQPSILSLVDDPHPAATELLDDAVMRDGMADHGWRPRLPRNVRPCRKASQCG